MVYHCSLRPANRLMSGGPSLGRSPARTSSVTPSIKIKSEFLGENRVDTIFRAGLGALLFFFRRDLGSTSSPPRIMAWQRNLIEQSFELAAERCEDLTPLVYRSLFREHPEAERCFAAKAAGL